MEYYGFTFFDILISIALLILAGCIYTMIYLRNKERIGYNYFFPHFIWKVIITYTFVYIYTNVYGGDTTAYFAGAQALKKLALENPSAYLTELFSRPAETIPRHYNHTTGYPPIWIYREANSWFVCKIASVLAFFSFNSFLCMNLLFSFISSGIVWRFFRFLAENTVFNIKYLAIAVLFMPTVGFWCTGLMKDTIVFCSILILLQLILKVMFNRKIRFLQLFGILLCSYVLASTRAFVLISIFIPAVLYLIFHLNNQAGFVIKFLTRTFGIVLCLTGIVLFSRFSNVFGEYSAENIVKTAEVTYNDFQKNQSYTGKRYDLGITEFTFGEMVKATPLAIITAIYRPFIWEAQGALMILNGLEGLLLLYFTLKLFRRRKNKTPEEQRAPTKEEIQTDQVVFMAIIFCLIIGFFVGFTSALFGVLVRMKAPIIPFVLLIVFRKLTQKPANQLSLSNETKA